MAKVHRKMRVDLLERTHPGVCEFVGEQLRRRLTFREVSEEVERHSSR